MKGLFMEVLKYKSKVPLKNKLIIIALAIILISAISVCITYAVNEKARDWINMNILRKEVTEEDVIKINIYMLTINILRYSAMGN